MTGKGPCKQVTCDHAAVVGESPRRRGEGRAGDEGTTSAASNRLYRFDGVMPETREREREMERGRGMSVKQRGSQASIGAHRDKANMLPSLFVLQRWIGESRLACLQQMEKEQEGARRRCSPAMRGDL